MNASELKTLFEEADRVVSALNALYLGDEDDDNDNSGIYPCWIIERLKSAVTDTLALVDECKVSGQYDAREHKLDKARIAKLEKRIEEMRSIIDVKGKQYTELNNKYFEMCQHVSGKKPRYINVQDGGPVYHGIVKTTLDDVSFDSDSDAGYSRIIDDAERTAGIK